MPRERAVTLKMNGIIGLSTSAKAALFSSLPSTDVRYMLGHMRKPFRYRYVVFSCLGTHFGLSYVDLRARFRRWILQIDTVHCLLD